ncbi:MAG: hypothetical protein CVU38_04035 [Chloroflexi bacterium HGW-Chloroflexi-1]|nr:MAG: hypothetical protein CVU38_04035 [Chloroflexi bacterium HGW-Chloroflexi-1]
MQPLIDSSDTLLTTMHSPKYRPYTLRNFRQLPQIARLAEEQLFAIEVVGRVLPFRTNNYVVEELIDWDDIPNDPIFVLNFPQRDMLRPQHFERVAPLLRAGAGEDEIRVVADQIRYELDPHPAGQVHNLPSLDGQLLPGMQHKYHETVLFFPSQGQTCHAYCTFCFRWPQFVGIDELKFAMRETESLIEYLHRHPEVTDVLFTGGDPLVMKTRILASYIQPLLDAELPSLQSIRIGTKSLAYWPYRFLADDDADDLLELFGKVARSGKHLAIMAHFNHPRELNTAAVRTAIGMIRETGAQIRTQSPLLAHINNRPEVWAEMWQEQVRLGCVPYYMFVARDSGLARTVRGPSMSAYPGKVQVLGVSEVDGDEVLEADGEPVEADFLPGLLAHFQWQGGTWGLPAGVNPLFVLYDPAAFESAGLEPPSPGWTWDDLFNAARQLTQREGDRVVRYGFADFGLGSIRSAVEALGGQLMDDSAESPMPMLDDPHTVAAVQRYADLALVQRVMVNPARERLDSFAVVQGGKVAMSVSLAQLWDGGRDEELRVAPLPDRSPVWLSGYFISAGTAHPEAAWRWLRFLSREVAFPNRLPARRSLIPDSAYAAAVGEEALKVFRYAAEHALPPLRPVAVEVLLRQAVERVLAGEEEVEDALTEAQEQALSLSTSGVTEPFTVPSPAPPEATMETITFLLTSHYQEDAYVALAKAFHEVHPDIKVIVRMADIDYPLPSAEKRAEKLKASGADCFRFSLPVSTVPELRQAVLNLQPFIDIDPTFPLDDYLPWALERARYGGDLWGLPAGVDVDVLWYNRTLFDEAGLPYPEDNWSWDDVFLTASRLAGGERDSRHYGFIIWPDGRGVCFLFEAVSGPLVDESPASPTFRFDAPEVVAAARQLANLVQDEVVPTPELEYSQDLFALIYANRVGMWVESSNAFKNPDFDFHPVPLPQSSQCPGFWLSSAYYIAADTPHAKACWEWLRFLSESIPDPGPLPPRHSLLTSDAFGEQVGADAQAAYLEALECKGRIAMPTPGSNRRWGRYSGRVPMPRPR